MPATWTLRAVLDACASAAAGMMPRRSSSGAQEGERMARAARAGPRDNPRPPRGPRSAASAPPRARCPRASAAANSGSGAPPSPRTRHKRLPPVEAEAWKASASASFSSAAAGTPERRQTSSIEAKGASIAAAAIMRRHGRWRGPSPCAGRGGAGGGFHVLPPCSGRPCLLQRAIPAAGIDADRPHLDAMLARVADELGGGVEAHRLGVEQGRAEDVRMMMHSSRTRRRRSWRSSRRGFRESRSCRSPRSA